MSKIEQKVKDWIMSKMRYPENMNANDHKMMDFFLGFFITTIPQFIGVMITYSLLSYMYLWGLKKYGMDKTLIVLLVGIIITIGQLSKSVRELGKN